MADAFKLQGSYETTPLGSSTSFAASIAAPIAETKTLKQKQPYEVTLTVNTPVAVVFGTVVNAHVVVLKATGKVRARITSADGATQSVPVDPYIILMSDSVPITAIDLTRAAGVETTVRVFLGEKA